MGTNYKSDWKVIISLHNNITLKFFENLKFYFVIHFRDKFSCADCKANIDIAPISDHSLVFGLEYLQCSFCMGNFYKHTYWKIHIMLS